MCANAGWAPSWHHTVLADVILPSMTFQNAVRALWNFMLYLNLINTCKLTPGSLRSWPGGRAPPAQTLSHCHTLSHPAIRKQGTG